jgi:2'-5' RNA ligase
LGSPPPSGIAVPFGVPPGIARLRRRWDRAAGQGARPHVTVLYPFLPEAELTPDVRAALATIAATVRPFDVGFDAVRRFDGVVWIEPDPAAPFRALTDAVAARWPAWPPYGGLFDEVIHHLTVVESETAPLDEVAAAAAAHVPFRRRASAMEVWRQDATGRWLPHWRLPLGGRPAR